MRFVTGLAFLPLLAVPALAGTFTVESCIGAPKQICSMSASETPGGNSNWNSIALSTPGFVYSFSGTVVLRGQFSISNGQFQNEQIPVSWDFYIAPQVANDAMTVAIQNYSWQLDFEGQKADFPTDTLFSTSGQGILSGLMHFTGSSLTHSLTGTYDTIQIVLQAQSSQPFSVSVPANSTLDFNPASVGTPEPGTIVLGGTALLLAALRTRKRSL